MTVSMICDHDTSGKILGYLPDRDRVYLKHIIPRTSCSRINGLKNKCRGGYIVQIKDTPVFTLSDSEETVDTSMELIQYDKNPTIILSFYK